MSNYPELVITSDLENENNFAIVPKGQENSNMHTRYGVCGRKEEAILFAAAPELLEALEAVVAFHSNIRLTVMEKRESDIEFLKLMKKVRGAINKTKEG
jgi:hypothetical protein